MSRRFITMGVDQLEQFVEANLGSAKELRAVLDELTHRKTKRAGLLRARVEGALRVEAPEAVLSVEARSDPESPKNASPAAVREPPPQIVEPPPPVPHPPVVPLPRTSGEHHLAVLEAWTALEVLSPQSFDRPQDLAPGESRVVDIDATTLPWQGGRHGKRDRRTLYQLSLGGVHEDGRQHPEHRHGCNSKAQHGLGLVDGDSSMGCG